MEDIQRLSLNFQCLSGIGVFDVIHFKDNIELCGSTAPNHEQSGNT
jgi:hypothetical protein